LGFHPLPIKTGKKKDASQLIAGREGEIERFDKVSLSGGYHQKGHRTARVVAQVKVLGTKMKQYRRGSKYYWKKEKRSAIFYIQL